MGGLYDTVTLRALYPKAVNVFITPAPTGAPRGSEDCIDFMLRRIAFPAMHAARSDHQDTGYVLCSRSVTLAVVRQDPMQLQTGAWSLRWRPLGQTVCSTV